MRFQNKKIYSTCIMILMLLGQVLLLIGNLCRASLSDFWFGYLEGFAVVGLLLGMIHIIYCRVQKRNYFTGMPL